jgi:ABC-type phosphate/phosphonate transport system substrate-binding protein
MKTLSNLSKMILIAGFSLLTLAIRSNTVPAETTKTKDTEKTIKSYFKFPGVLVPLHHVDAKSIQHKVEVLFTTDLAGNVNFALAKTGDQDLKSEIEKQFLKLHLDKLKQNVVHSVTLSFRTL